MPKITIDNIELEVEEGINFIQAASKIGIDIPHFCYHPSLSTVAQCRQCLVEVEGIPKVLPACNTFVREGAVVKTNSQKALKAREAAVEFTLINHPLDCPICDKGGECPLQLTTFNHGPSYSRIGGPENKKVRQKYYLSDDIVYDPNRCIMCTRCVRFTDEVTKTHELGTVGRGFRKKIAVFPDKELNNELAGNVVDICPVGALLTKETLHEERVWYWKFTDSVCSLCSNGCNITVGVDPRKGKISRIRPRTNKEVNDYWVCDKGRYGFNYIQGSKRLTTPIIKNENGYERIDWEEAIQKVYEVYLEFNTDPLVKTAIITSATLTNEEIFAARKLSSIFKNCEMGSTVGKKFVEKKYDIISNDEYPNSTGIRDFKIADESNEIHKLIDKIINGEITFLFIVGSNLFDVVKEDKLEQFKDALKNIRFLTIIDYKLTENVKFADLILPGLSPYEKDGTYTNDEGRIQRIRKTIEPPANSKPDWEILCMIGGKCNKALFDYSCPSEINEDIGKHIPEYRGINFERIGMLGCPKHKI